MRFRRTSRLFFLLLLIAMLPLRSYSAAMHCGANHAASAAQGSHQSHCPPSGAAPHSHLCQDCCCVAAAQAPERFSLPPTPAAGIVPRSISPPPALALERLDRPPRLAS